MAIRDKPRVVLGLLTFGPPGSEDHGTRISSLDKFGECLDHFQEQGYNEVDTARTYVGGLQEAHTRALKWQERGLSLATKWYPYTAGQHAGRIVKQQLEKSLSELGSESVDIFYLHAPDRTVPFEETLDACNELFQAGKFKTLGLSNYAAWEVSEVWNIANERGWVKPKVYQVMYNALTRTAEEELFPCCQKYGIDILAYNPLAGGVLSGKYADGHIPADGGRFSDTDGVIGKQYRQRYFKDANFEALAALEPVVRKHGLTLIEVAFRWLLHHSQLNILTGNDGIVIGISSLEQLVNNLQHLEKGPLPEEVVQVLDDIWENITKPSAVMYWR
jgi:aflatoxin B1 aldehyde reductase